MNQKYTEAVHARRVKKVIEKERPSMYCPAARGFCIGPVYDLWTYAKNPCFICTEFIGLKHYTPEGEKCPCHRLGTKRAVELTWQKLEEKGYLWQPTHYAETRGVVKKLGAGVG